MNIGLPLWQWGNFMLFRNIFLMPRSHVSPNNVWIWEVSVISSKQTYGFTDRSGTSVQKVGKIGRCHGCWYPKSLCQQGPDSIQRCHLTSIGNPIVEIRRSYNRLISTMGSPILVRRHLYIESGPRSSTAKILPLHDEWILFFHKKAHKLCAPSQWWEMTESANLFLWFLKPIQLVRGQCLSYKCM